MAYEMNAMPGVGNFDEEIRIAWPIDGKPLANRRFEITRANGSVVRGTTDAEGKTGLQKSDFPEDATIRLLPEA